MVKSKQLKQMRQAEKKYDPDQVPELAAAIESTRSKISQTAVFYSYPMLIGLVIPVVTGKLDQLKFPPFFWGVLFWYVALMLRHPVKAIVAQIPLMPQLAGMTLIMGLAESIIKAIALHVFPNSASTPMGPFTFAFGWMSIDALGGLVSLYAAVAVLERKDERAAIARKRMAEAGMPSPLTISPWFSFFERLGEGLLGFGIALIIGKNVAWTPHVAIVQSIGMYVTRVYFKGSVVSTEALTVFGALVFWNGLYVAGFLDGVKLFIWMI